MPQHDRLSGNKPAARAPSREGAVGTHSITGPPEYVRAVEMQRAYWTHHPDEQAMLEARGVSRLEWRERLRLHHLLSMERIGTGPQSEASTGKCRQSLRALLASDSPYRTQMALVWQGESEASQSDREPDITGEFVNASLTHLGSLEVFHVDAEDRPTRLGFVGVHELAGVDFGPPTLIRAARLRYEDGREELVLVPLVYGLTRIIDEKLERQGELTRFVAHLDAVKFGDWADWGIGVGLQVFYCYSRHGTSRLIGMSSVARIVFPIA